MGVLHFPAMLLFQDAASMANDVHWIMICEIVLTLIVVLMLLGVAVAGLVIYSKVTKLMNTVNAKAQPLIAQATPLVAKGKEIAAHVNDIVADLKPKIAAVTSDVQPKIASVTSDVQHISSVVRGKVDEVGQTVTRINETVQGYNQTAQDVNVKAKGQVERVNGLVSDALTTTQQVSKQIQTGIKVPVEKIASWVTAAKVGIENLADKVPFLQHIPGMEGFGGKRPKGPKGGSRPGPVPVATSGARVVHSAADDVLTTGLPARNTPFNS